MSPAPYSRATINPNGMAPNRYAATTAITADIQVTYLQTAPAGVASRMSDSLTGQLDIFNIPPALYSWPASSTASSTIESTSAAGTINSSSSGKYSIMASISISTSMESIWSSVESGWIFWKKTWYFS